MRNLSFLAQAAHDLSQRITLQAAVACCKQRSRRVFGIFTRHQIAPQGTARRFAQIDKTAFASFGAALHTMLYDYLPVFSSRSPMFKAHSSEARKPVSSNTRISARSLTGEEARQCYIDVADGFRGKGLSLTRQPLGLVLSAQVGHATRARKF